MATIKISIITGILLVLVIAVIFVFNKLVKNRNLMQEAWSGTDVFLKKRHDLTPQLVNTVKGYAAHEKATFEEITRYRAEAMQAKRPEAQVAAENRLGKALSGLQVVVENYPDLKANEHFLLLQKQLAGLEHDLEYARRYYNGTVRVNNTYAESFPSNIIARMFNFRKGVFFAVDAMEKEIHQITI
jgi:LemA protein